jgi:hypothetical protein
MYTIRSTNILRLGYIKIIYKYMYIVLEVVRVYTILYILYRNENPYPTYTIYSTNTGLGYIKIIYIYSSLIVNSNPTYVYYI